MEDRERPFEAIKVSMASAETGEDRFIKDVHSRLPLRAFWRLNLTALSQQYNLYFVASAHEIHVYEPEFPFQKLGGKPRIVLTPQLANASASGYINPNYPHCINHLIVGTLGNQEIVLLATDSGNVTAYETKLILNAVQEHNSQPAEIPAAQHYVDIRPFFAHWVVESAWGLSIHSEGRMIAVSSNTPASPRRVVGIDGGRASITIFAFALMLGKEDDDDDDEEQEVAMEIEPIDHEPEWHTWDPKLLTRGSTTPGRDKNYKIVLNGMEGHTMNIPCITFINQKEDRTGSWLLSADIHEDVKLWQIWTAKCKKTWRFKESSATGAAWLDGRELGWSVAVLDKRSFQTVSNLEGLIGYRRAPQYYGYTAHGASFDITNIVRHHVPSNALSHPLNEDEGDIDPPSESESIRIFEDLTDSESTADEADRARIERIQSELQASLSPSDNPREISSPNDPGNASADFGGVSETQSASDESSNDELDFDIDSNFSDDLTSDLDTHSDYMASEPSAVSASTSHSIASPARNSQHESDSHPDLSTSEESTTATVHAKARLYCKAADQPNPVRGKRHPLNEIPEVPFLYCSSSHVRLLGSTHAASPHLFCARVLRQSLGPNLEDGWIVPMDRLDMVEQIPELGLVVIASQAGRCAICSLTRRSTDGVIGLRVDWILPSQKQEHAGTRPVTALLGIAVSPIQGRHGAMPTKSKATLAEHLISNRDVDDISTIFDHATVDLSDVNEPARPIGQTVLESPLLSNHDEIFGISDLVNASQSTSRSIGTTTVPHLPMKSYKWAEVRIQEPWKVVDGSRRYRLMMTYADMTVLTYELYRGVERNEIRADELS